MSLLIVITSYRATDLTIDCLKSLEKEISQIPEAKVGICENGNKDDTAQKLQQAIDENEWQDWVYQKTVMPNRGFAGGNNAILREVLQSSNVPDFFLLLNADTIVQPGAITRLLKLAQSRSDVGIFCPRLEWPSGEAQISCFRYISPLSEFLAAAKTGPLTKLLHRWKVPVPIVDTPLELEWGSFACALIRKEVFLDIGMLDEGYYLYFDDVDFCRSANNAEWKVLYCPNSHVIHLRGKSNPVKERTAQRKRRPDYWYLSRSWYLGKFYGKHGLFIANMLWLLGRMISLSREIVGHKHPHLCKREEFDIWKGFLKTIKPRTKIEKKIT